MIFALISQSLNFIQDIRYYIYPSWQTKMKYLPARSISVLFAFLSSWQKEQIFGWSTRWVPPQCWFHSLHRLHIGFPFNLVSKTRFCFCMKSRLLLCLTSVFSWVVTYFHRCSNRSVSRFKVVSNSDTITEKEAKNSTSIQ